MTTIPAGVVVLAGDNIPEGWLLCDGRLLDKISIRTCSRQLEPFTEEMPIARFKLPNYCGMFLRGVNHGRGFDPDAGRPGVSRDVPGNPGNNGDQVGSIQAGALENHSHGVGVNAGDSLTCAASGGLAFRTIWEIRMAGVVRKPRKMQVERERRPLMHT